LQGSRLHYFPNKGDPVSQSLGFIDILAASAIVPSFPTPTSTNSSTKVRLPSFFFFLYYYLLN
jgi:hypothetical protein